jgi:hypothetical protein
MAPRKLSGFAAHHVAALTEQQRPGQILLTPCPHCGTSLPRLEAIQHASTCPSRPGALTIDSPESAGTRGHDGMVDA